VGGEISNACPEWPWGPPSHLYKGYQVFPGGKERPGRDADPSPTSSAVGQERVELYLYSPYGSYGLYTALTLRLLMSYIYIYIYIYIYEAPILDVSRSHTNDAAQSVGLLWTSDQLVAETST
jgi:hypothetical protein